MTNVEVDGIRVWPLSAFKYTAPAVHFDGTTWLDCPKITAPNSPHLFAGAWVQFDTINGGGNNLFDFDPSNREIVLSVYPSQVVISSSPDGVANLQWTAPTAIFADGKWHHVMMHTNTETKVAQLYVDDAAIALTVTSDHDPFVQPFSGLEVALPDNTAEVFLHPLIGSMSDAFVAPGLALDLSVAANRAFFISGGKPVNPLISTTALGMPAMLFSGDATGFPENQGTGGSFVINKPLANATSSPSG